MSHVLLFLAIKSHFLFVVLFSLRYQHKRDVDERPIKGGSERVLGD